MKEVVLLPPDGARQSLKAYAAIVVGEVSSDINADHVIRIHKDDRKTVETVLSAAGILNANQREELGVRVYGSFKDGFFDDGGLSKFVQVIQFLRRRGFDVTVVIAGLPRGMGLYATGDVRLPRRITRRGADLPNPAKSPDFFDLVRQLNNALEQLSREIASVNDPDRRTAEVRAARAYLDSFRAFLDDKEQDAPDTIPLPLPTDVRKRVSAVDWFNISGHAQKWAELIVKLIDKIF